MRTHFETETKRVTQKWLIGPTHERKPYHDEGHTQNIPTDQTALQILLMNPDLKKKNIAEDISQE